MIGGSEVSERLSILLLCHEPARITGTINDHLQAFKTYSQHNVVILDSMFVANSDLDVQQFDAIILHYSLVIASESYIPQALASKITRFQGPKILFIQDEYRWVNKTSKAIRNLGVQTVFTLINPDIIRKVYRDPWFDHVRFEHTLTGFVPEELAKVEVPDYASRPIDVAYRARKLPAWAGAFGQEKWIIGHKFQEDAPKFSLKCDIECTEASRIYGKKWVRFLSNAKAVLGTESGVGFVDYTGEVCKQVNAYEARHPNISFEKIRDLFLEGRDGKIIMNVISPRCFEAAALRTLMVMYEGEYSGVLEAGKHYAVLERDHSNMAEIAEIIVDPERAGPIIDQAYREIACSNRWTFQAFIRRVDNVVEEEAVKYVTSSLLSQKVQDAASRLTPQVVERLEQQSSLSARSYARRIRVASFMMRSLSKVLSVSRVMGQLVPQQISSPTQNVSKKAGHFFKPRLKRLLLGISE